MGFSLIEPVGTFLDMNLAGLKLIAVEAAPPPVPPPPIIVVRGELPETCDVVVVPPLPPPVVTIADEFVTFVD
jgi:hypothetical protein